MSYIIAHVQTDNWTKPLQVNCFRNDIQGGDEVVVKMEDGTLERARVFKVCFQNWNKCKHTVECLVSEATLDGDVVVLPEGGSLFHKGMTRDEDLERKLDEFGWVHCRDANKIAQPAYMWVNKSRTALISFRRRNEKSKGIDIQIWRGQPDVEMSSNNVLRVRPPACRVIWQPYHDSPYNILERTADFASEFQKDRQPPRVRGTHRKQSTSREPDEGYTTKDIYDDNSDGEGGKVYLGDGVYIDENGDWS
jgi:hypothetical protein